MICFRNGKKQGNIAVEGITILLIIVVFALLGMFAYQTFDELNTDIQASDMGTTGKEVSSDLFNVFPSWVDNAFIFIFVMFILFVLVSSYFIDTHPIFFGVSIFLLIGVIIAALLVGNVYDDIANDDEISSYANNLPYTYWIMTHIAEMMIAVVFIIVIALFAKFKNS